MLIDISICTTMDYGETGSSSKATRILAQGRNRDVDSLPPLSFGAMADVS